ncbi:SSrecog-domain-containing protein [Hesseltinella vesiculosa]|uniref:FACT complex subunit POB3 n=1 Tax=Hesseltinella vesiculosa TaxID=101127 RepID=A0A1X2G6T5_9FUNG|nr:SSrecog-domain-containing protein [Hesseltinella vesiculosa]
MTDRVVFDSIHKGMSQVIGQFRIKETGVGWRSKAEGTTESFVVEADKIRRFAWIRVARGYQLRVYLKDNHIQRFDGFKNEDLDGLKDAVKKFYKMQIEVKEPCLKGWNWGHADFQGSELLFNVGSKPVMELPLASAIGASKVGKSEVSINFVDPGQPAPEGVNPKQVDELMDVTFYIPGTVKAAEASDDDEEEVHADVVFYDTVKSKLELSQLTTENIVQFPEVLCLTPRGRYNIDMYQDFLRLRGKTYDYKILYSSITRFFLLLKPDELHVLFVIALDPPLRQGQTKHPFLVLQFVREDEIDVELNLDAKLDEKYENKLQRHYDAPTYEVVSTIFRTLTGRKVHVPTSFRSHHGANAIKCSMKALEGFLYPLDKCFLFIPKPTTYIPIADISMVAFTRVGTQSGGSSRTFDMKFHLRSGTDVQFSSINREEYATIEAYLRQKQIKVKSENVQESVISYVDMDDGEDDDGMDSRKKRRLDADEDDEDESPDEDFAPGGESGSDIAEEYDSEAEASDPGSDDE